jgi:tetratricopeptide (TPR) repeat protein
MALISHDQKIFAFITSGLSINQMIESRSFPEGSLYKAIYFLLTSGVVTFSDHSEQQGAGDRMAFLKKTHHQLATLETTEALNALLAMTRTTAARPQIVFQEFLQFIGEEPSSREKELLYIYGQILERVKQLTHYMATPEYSQIQKAGQQGSAEKRILALRLFEEAQQSLVKSQFKEANEKLKKVAELDRKISGLSVLKAWGKLGGIETNPSKASLIKEVELDLLQIEPEEKLDAQYAFVQGLLYKAKGEYNAGKKSFEKAISLDPNFLVARREISIMQSLTKKQPDLLNADLRSIVGSFFGKK